MPLLLIVVLCCVHTARAYVLRAAYGLGMMTLWHCSRPSVLTFAVGLAVCAQIAWAGASAQCDVMKGENPVFLSFTAAVSLSAYACGTCAVLMWQRHVWAQWCRNARSVQRVRALYSSSSAPPVDLRVAEAAKAVNRHHAVVVDVSRSKKD